MSKRKRERQSVIISFTLSEAKALRRLRADGFWSGDQKRALDRVDSAISWWERTNTVPIGEQREKI